jgi:hypothetical protein
MRRRLTVSYGILVFVLVGAATASAKSPAELSLLGDEALEVQVEEGASTAELYVTLLNSSPFPASFEAEFQAASAEEVAIESVSPETLDGSSAERVKLVFSGVDSLEEEAAGQLVITGGEAPVTRPVSILPAPQPSAPWLEIIVLGAVGVSVVLMLVIIGVIPAEKRALLGKPAVGPTWTLESWAGILTTIGALFGTLLGAITLPEVPRQVDKETLVSLNLAFPVLLAIAAFVFYAIRPPRLDASKQDAGLTGFNVVLLFSCCLTGGAVLGQLASLGLLGWELFDGVWPWVATGVLVLVAGLALYYCAVTGYSLATTDWEAKLAEAKEEEERSPIMRPVAPSGAPGVRLARAGPRRPHFP